MRYNTIFVPLVIHCYFYDQMNKKEVIMNNVLYQTKSRFDSEVTSLVKPYFPRALFSLLLQHLAVHAFYPITYFFIFIYMSFFIHYTINSTTTGWNSAWHTVETQRLFVGLAK